MRVSLAVVASAAIMLAATSAHADDLQTCVRSAEQAQSERRQHRLLSAREQVMTCVRVTCPSLIRADCGRWLEELDTVIPTLAVRATSPTGDDVSASVEIDGQRIDVRSGAAVRVDPGSHVIVVKADGYERAERRVMVTEGERGRVISVPLTSVVKVAPALPRTPEEPSPDTGLKPPSPLVYVLAGVGLVSLGSFTYFGLTGKSDASQLRSGCNINGTCTQSDVDDVKTKYLVADVSLGIGIVSLGVAAVLWWQQQSR